MSALAICLLISAAVLTFGALASVNAVGKPREPMQPGTAAISTIVSAFAVVVMVLAAVKLR